jgi:hypothetical protein
MKRLGLVDLAVGMIFAIILLFLCTSVCDLAEAGEPLSPKQLNDRILTTILQREGYADTTIARILKLPRLERPLVVPDTLMMLDKTAADDLIANFGTRLRISDDGRWAGVCSLNKYKDEAGWHICMDVQVLYPKGKKL